MDLRIEFYKAAFFQQCNVFDNPVFRETSKYQYGQGLCDVLRSIVRFISRVDQVFKPVAMKGIQTMLKAGSKAIKKGATVKDVIKCTLKPTICAVIGATVDHLTSKLIEMRDSQNDAPPPNPPIVVPEFVQAGSGKKRRSRSVYKKTLKVFF